ncbi:hypothetical protein QM012_001716 [Aureobasidium pullulans]|uniref:Major facilitator superfamily (MFS) profile domain-containing protein n=1 Tax=Aureobasidium pullulans TaxID=5580 RepID=A0ABR0TCB0_AURPU
MFEKLESNVTARPASIASGPNTRQDADEQGHDESQMWQPSQQVKLIVAVQAFVCFAVALDSTILTTTLPALSEALHTNTTQTFWTATSYLLTSAIFQPPIAALADVFGRQAMFLLAITLFTIGSIICCASHGIASMLVGRSIQGIGGGGILSVNLIILSDIIPLRQRAQYQGYLQLCFALGSNIAPVIGGLIVQKTTWRWLFYINLPFYAISLATVPFVIRYTRPKTTAREQLLSIDWMGIILSIASTTLFLVGISWGGTEYSWSSAATLCPLLIGLGGVILTIIYEMNYQWAIWLGWMLFTLGMGVMIQLQPDTPTVAYIFMFICAGTGLGLLFNSLSAAIQAISPTKDVAYASSMFAFMRSLGLCLGVSIGGTIFQNFLERRLEHYSLSPQIANQAQAYIESLRFAPASPEKTLAKEIINWAFQMLLATLCGISGLGLVISAAIGRYSMDKELDSQHVIA